MEFKTISLEDIDLPGDNPRLTFVDESMDQLVASLKRDGLIEPIVVKAKGHKYELVVGERRVRAAIRANIPRIPAIVRDDITAEEASRLRLIENINRKDLDVFERVGGIKAHMEKYGRTLEQTASDLSLSADTVRSWFRIAESTSPTIKRVDTFIRRLGIDTLQLLSKYVDETQERLAQAIVENDLKQDQVRRLVSLFDSNPSADIDTLMSKAREQVKVVEITVPEEEAERIIRERRLAREREEKASEKLLQKHLRKRQRRVTEGQAVAEPTLPPPVGAPTTVEAPYQLPAIKRLWDEALGREVEDAHLSGKELELLERFKDQFPTDSMRPEEVSSKATELVGMVLNESRPQIVVLEMPPRLYKALDSLANSEGILPKDAALALLEEGLEVHGFWKRQVIPWKEVKVT